MKNSDKILVLRREDSYGNISDNTSGFTLRRTSLNVNRSIEQTASNVISTSLQDTKIYNGRESISLSVNSELTPGSFSEIIRSYTGRGFSKTQSLVTSDLTIVDNNNTTYSLYGFASTAGVTLGSICRLSGNAVLAVNKTNLIVTGVQVSSLTVRVLNNGSLTAQTGIVGSLDVVGARTYIPTHDNVKDSFTLESYAPNVSMLYSGLIVNNLSFKSSAYFCDFTADFVAQKLKQKGTSQVLTAVKQFSDNPVNIIDATLLINNTVTYVTNFQIQCDKEIATTENIASNNITDFYVNKYTTTASFTAALKDLTYENLLNQNVSITLVLAVDNTNSSEFIRFSLPNAKVTAVNQDDSSVLLTSFEVESTYLSTGDIEDSTLIIQQSSNSIWNWDDLDTWSDSNIWYD